MIGTTLKDRYIIAASLGIGGMGEVFLATDAQVNYQRVAIKMLEAHLARNREYLDRFQQEAVLLRRLDHPNIVKHSDNFSVGGRYFIVMEYVEGGNLLDLLAARGPLSETDFRRIALALIDALTRAHDTQVTHRDIKPENILLTQDGFPKLSDFGVAGLLEQTPARASLGLGGSPYYMSPQLWERPEADQLDDIWSLGVVMFEMLAGRAPFRGPTEASIIHAIWAHPTPDLREIRPDLPQGYAAIIERCLEKDPANRYQTMRELAVDLERGYPLDGLERRDGLFPKPRRIWLWAMLAVLLVVILGGGGLLLAAVTQVEPTPTAVVVMPSEPPDPTATLYVITATPPATPGLLPTRTPRLTETPFVITATLEPTETLTSTPTFTPSATSTLTDTPTVTLTPTDTATASVTPTVTASPTDTATPTSTSTSTVTLTATGTDTATPTATITNTPRPTLTATATSTSTPDFPATEQADIQATLDQISTYTAPTPTFAPTALALVSTPVPEQPPGVSSSGIFVLDDFSNGTAERWELPVGWAVVLTEHGNTVLQANQPGTARKLDAADWGRHYSLQFRFRLEQGDSFAADLFGDVTRCRSVYLVVENEQGILRYNNREPVNGRCPRDDFVITTMGTVFTSFVWHTLRLEARDDVLMIFLNNTRLAVVRNPLPATLGPNGLISVLSAAGGPVLFDDFVVNALSPTDDRDVTWLTGEIYCLQDMATGEIGVALEARIEGDEVEGVWALGPTDVGAQSFLLSPSPDDGADGRHYWRYIPDSIFGLPLPGTYTFVPLREGVEVTGRRFFVPNRGELSLSAAPRRIQVSVNAQGVQLFWQAVASQEGIFNPGGSYMVRLSSAEASEFERLFEPLYEDRGASSVPRYFLPWGLLNRPPSAHGALLQDLPDGDYLLEVWAVSGRPASGDECRAIDSRETLRVNVAGSVLTITQPDGGVSSGVMGDPTPTPMP